MTDRTHRSPIRTLLSHIGGDRRSRGPADFYPSQHAGNQCLVLADHSVNSYERNARRGAF